MSHTVASLALPKLTGGSRQTHLLWQACLFTVHTGACPSPFLWSSRRPTLFAMCAFQFLVYYSFLIFWGSLGQSVQGTMLVYPRGGCGSTMCCLFAHMLVCISQAGLEPASGGVGALLFSQCDMVWRSFVLAGGSRCQSFASSWCFFPAKYGSNVSARFLIYRAQAVCFLPLVAILDPSST
jgi:hypothetical protein